MHHRFSPKVHHFAYRIFLFAIDLDELPALHRRLRLFSFNRANAYSFRDRDYLPVNEPIHNPAKPKTRSATAATASLKERVAAFLSANGIELGSGQVILVTLPRVLGYLFNPVSFYFCFDPTGAPLATIAEVTNTFREVKPYLLGPATRDTSGAFRLRVPKHFYVSPYSDVDVSFDFLLRPLAEKLSIQIDDYHGSERSLTSTLTGSSRPLNDRTLAWFTLKYPLITLKVITLIHWHALRLYLKKIPWFRKAARPADQRGLYRPHLSLASPPDA